MSPAQREAFEISPFSLTKEYQGVGIPKGEVALTEAVDEALRVLEKNGQATVIYDRWFGPDTQAAQTRRDVHIAPLANNPKLKGLINIG